MARPATRAAFLDLAPEVGDFADSVLQGLGRTPKHLDCAFFYDEEGSRLFEEITTLPEYYPTRAETLILERHGAEIAATLGPGVQLLELGSGSSAKVRLLLDNLEEPAGYVGVDISREHLRAACDSLAADHPGLEVLALCADYMQEVPVPPPKGGLPRRLVGFFPGSTIGNLEPDAAVAFLARWRDRLRHGGREPGGMLVGVDLKKDKAVLDAAYDDARGVTAAFNLNVLARINRELGGSFDLDAFRHRAAYDPAKGRVEMHLVSTRDQIVTAAGRRFAFAAGEAIHTENSCKYAIPEFQAVAARAGYRPDRVWTDPDHLFSVHWLLA